MAPTCSAEALQLLQEGSLTLSRVEAAGVRIDTDYLDTTSAKIDQTIDTVTKRMKKHEIYTAWHRHFGPKTNLDSHRQLATVLFEVMKFESNTVTATGKKSTTADALEDLELDFVYDFQEVQHLKTKTQKTYLNGIRREMVKHADGFYYVHPFYNLHTAATYRSSCNDPNFQNVPKRNPDMAKLIRPCYLPHPGHHMVEVDFSQLEVRIAACYHKDPVMMKYIRDPKNDMHGDTAMKLFLLAKEDVCKKTTRDSTKNQFVFPEFYGSTYTNCARNIWKAMARRNFRVGKDNDGIPIREHLASKGVTERGDCVMGTEPRRGTFEYVCKQTEDYFWNKMFRVYTEWKREWVDLYRKRGWFKMLTGFVVKNGVYAKNDVINYPIQGSAFHCLLWCLIKIDKWFRKYKMRSRIIGEIHDSGVFSVHPKELQDFLTYARHVMTVLLPQHWRWINVPLETEADVSPVDHNWYTAAEYKLEDALWQLKA